MKFNWGTGIVIGIAAFMIFILQYVIRVQTDKSLDNELVTEAYYQKEIAIDGNYKKEQNALSLGNQLNIESNKEGIALSFPEAFNINHIKGTISLYRPSNQQLDNTIPLKLSSHYLLIPKNQLESGRWDIILEFSYQGIEYLKKESVHIK